MKKNFRDKCHSRIPNTRPINDPRDNWINKVRFLKVLGIHHISEAGVLKINKQIK